MHLNQSFSSHSSFRVGFSADGALVREQRASLAKRYEKGVGTRMYHRHIKDFHKRNEVTIKNSVYHIFKVLTSNSIPSQYNYFLFDKKGKTIRGMHASNKLTTPESTAVQGVDPGIFDGQAS